MFLSILFLAMSLQPCQESPNCVCSQATDSRHAIEPFPVFTTPQKDLKIIRSIILKMPRTKLVKETDSYLHFEFVTKIFRFTDDVEFLINSEKNVIDVRSASRIGWSDLGTNRKRVEDLREKYLSYQKSRSQS